MLDAEHSPGALSLRNWQREMQDCIIVPQRDRTTLRAWLDSGSFDVDTQLGIYGNAYFLRLTEALRSNHPMLHQVLGDEDFDTMAQAYIDRHPSAHASIRWFGAKLASFLRDTQPWSSVPVLSELAAFEWAIRHTVDAADDVRWTVEDLLTVPAENWGKLCFALHPSVSRLSLQWNAPQLIRALTDVTESGNAPPLVPAVHPGHWLIYRKPDLTSGWHSVPDMEHAALEHLQQGATFGDICVYIAGFLNGEPALHAAGMLRCWVELGLLVIRESSVRAVGGRSEGRAMRTVGIA
jgi:hypothetical protein